jgi:hypothetical protein
MKNPGVKYGVLALVITIVWTFIEHFLGYNTTNHETGQYARMVGAFVFYILIFVAIYQARKQQNGFLSFGQGFKVGATVSIIYSLGCCALYALYGELINTQYKPTLMAFERAKLVATNASATEIDAKMKEVDMTSGGSVLSYVFLVVFMFLIGCVVSAVAALIFKRKAKTV